MRLAKVKEMLAIDDVNYEDFHARLSSEACTYREKSTTLFLLAHRGNRSKGEKGEEEKWKRGRRSAFVHSTLVQLTVYSE